MIDEGHAYLPCPEYKCSLIIDDDTALSLIKDPQMQAKYNRLVTNSFVEVGATARPPEF